VLAQIGYDAIEVARLESEGILYSQTARKKP
jgi:hypothetical protein